MKVVLNLLLVISFLLFIASGTMFVVASEFRVFNYSLLIAAALIASVITFLKRSELITFAKSKLFKSLLRETLTMALVLSILGIINYIVFKNNRSFDLTKNKIHSLSEQTEKVLKTIGKNQVEFILYAKRSDWERYLKLLNMYKKVSSHIDIRVIDVDTEPALVAMNKVTENGTLLIRYKNKEYRTLVKDELALTNMLMKIVSPQDITLYFSTGHNESALDDEGQDGMSYLAQVLENSNFKMKMHDLARPLPKDASALIIFKPQISFSIIELDHVRKYLDSGGSLVMTLAPRFDQIELSNLQSFLSSYGVEFVNGIVLDRLSASQGGQASVPMINTYPEGNPITKGFEGRTLFPVTSFFKLSSNSNFKWSSLVSSLNFPATWGESDFSEVKSGKATYNEGVDEKGPLDLAVVGESNSNDAKIILFGSSAFISNQFQGQANNFNLFLNAIGWAADEKSILSLDRPELVGNLIYISEIHFTLIFYFVILFFPFIFFGIGIYFYRRKLSR